MAKDERIISTELLEVITEGYDKGKEVLITKIEYDKAEYSRRPRGYYLVVTNQRNCDNGSIVVMLGSGAYEKLLLQECKAFNAKTFEKVTASEEQIAVLQGKARAKLAEEKQRKAERLKAAV